MWFAKQFMFNHVKQELFNLYDALNLLYQFTKIAKIDLKIPSDFIWDFGKLPFLHIWENILLKLGK